MQTISYYELLVHKADGGIQYTVRFLNKQKNCIEETCYLNDGEVSRLLLAWREGQLMGSFGIDTVLAPDARFIVVTC